MVRTDTNSSKSTLAVVGHNKGPTGSKIDLTVSVLRNIFFNLCEACQFGVMAAIPPSAFSAGRIRETQRDMKVSTFGKGGGGSNTFYNSTAMELSPLKYNSKLMNSIWGFYNRYSPHNVKKVNDDGARLGEYQQQAGTSLKNALPPPAKLDNVWTAINVSQSH